jgi:DNA-directed RNA polymerase, mitochondrial
MPTIEDQINLEHEMLQAGIERYDSQNIKLTGQSQESKTTYGRALIAGVVSQVTEEVKELQLPSQSSRRCVARGKIKEMDAEQVAYLALVSVIDSVSKRYSLLKVARAVGGHIEDQDRLAQWVAGEKEKAKRVLEKANEKSTRRHKRLGLLHKMELDGYVGNEWTNEEKIFVGVKLIDVIIRVTGLVRLTKLRTARNKTTTFVEATPETLEWIRKFNEYNSRRKPRYAPCIIPPRDWEGVWGGGYYSDVINRLPLVRAH